MKKVVPQPNTVLKSGEPLPTYLIGVEPAHDAFWEKIERQFDEYRALLEGMMFETRDEAAGTSQKPRGAKQHKWKDSTPHWSGVKPWMLVPYIHALNREELDHLVELGRKEIPFVETALKARQLTPAFLHRWGTLSHCAGAVHLVYHSQTDIGRERNGENANRDGEISAQRRWFARYFVRWRPHFKSGAATRHAIEKLINCIIDGSVPVAVDGEIVSWFEKFLNTTRDRDTNPNYEKLTKEFRARLTEAELERLAQEPFDDLPALDLPPPSPTP